MSNKKCSEMSNDILIAELEKMTREAVDWLTEKKEKILAKRKVA